MTNVAHASLTGADLHEPKGIATAAANSVYVANGLGSGTWTDASTAISNSSWSTGDIKLTHKNTADSGWIMYADGTIGDGSSGASVRANADCTALFQLYWNTYNNSQCPVSGGRGASAVADFAAHKTLTLPVQTGRGFGLAGTGSGLQARSVGTGIGSETHTLTLSELPTGMVGNNSNNVSISVNSGGSLVWTGVGGGSVATGGASQQVASIAQLTSTGTIGSGSINVQITNTGGGAHSIMNPMGYVNAMIKL
jgi:hypothetical protein